MGLLSRFDFADGDLPPWINQAVAVARPLFTASAVAIPSLGMFSVSSVAFFSPLRATAMVKAATDFLGGIPDAGWGAITAIALGYTASKSVEAIKAPKPVGGSSPEVPKVADADAASAGLDPENS